MHSVRPRRRHYGGDRGGTSPPLCRDDTRQGRSPPRGPAALLHSRAEHPRRSACLRRADPLYPRFLARAIRRRGLAMRSPWTSAKKPGRKHTGRRRGPHARHVALTEIKVSKMGQPASASTGTEVLAGLVERVTFHNAENGFCVLRITARGHRDLITVVGHAAVI